MGSFGGWSLQRWPQIIYSAVKVPMLLGISFGLTMPGFVILNNLLGLRPDLRLAVRAVSNAQAGLAITLVGLAPFVGFFYASCNDHSWAILFNGMIFAIATVTGQVLLRRGYRGMIGRNPRHRFVMRTWPIVYGFIAIQMAWVLRPFVGEEGQTTSLFRQNAWGNAYVVIGNLIRESVWH